WPDLFVTSYGDCILYRNNRDGTFTDVTERAGVKTSGWTTSAVWFDYDNDGKLDLFVCSYVDYSGKEHTKCSDDKTSLTYYCPPRIFPGTLSYLYHNNGDGTFTEVRKGTDIDTSEGKALGVVAADMNNDGRMDLFVANDMAPNFLFMNRGRGFEEIALPAEVAYSRNGVARSGMGVDAADLFGSGYQDLFVANIDQEMYSLYRNQKNETFRDAAAENEIAPLTRSMSGWGLKFFDYDNDGALDLIIANGHPDDHIGERSALSVSYKEPLLLFHQEGGRLRHVPGGIAGPAFSTPYAGRGLAVGDFNNDGLVDVLITTNGGAPVLLKNESARGNHWLGLKLRGTACNCDAIGAKIRWSAGGVVRSRNVNGGGSYLSAHDPRVVLGTGSTAAIEWVEITWPKPSGKVQRIANPPMDRYMTVTEG
ncbi:MAG TPA: CRTAC1 family protein, partial [Gemmataceae bacterium]